MMFTECFVTNIKCAQAFNLRTTFKPVKTRTVVHLKFGKIFVFVRVPN